MGMRRSDSLSHVESAMSSVKSLRGRGLDLPHTGRWLRRKHRYASRVGTTGRWCERMVARWFRSRLSSPADESFG